MMLVLGCWGPLKAPAAQRAEPLLQRRRRARHLLQEAGLLQQLLLQILHRPQVNLQDLDAHCVAG